MILSEVRKYEVRYLKITHLVVSHNIVHSAWFSVQKTEFQCFAMVEHIDPIAYVLAVAVNRDSFLLDKACDGKRYEFLRILMGPEVIRTVRNDDRNPPRRMVGAAQKIAPGLRRRLGNVRRKCPFLFKSFV